MSDEPLADGVRELLDRPLVRKLLRYSATSAIGIVFGQGSLLLLTAVAGWPGVPANVASVTIGAVPSYLMNRYWTWQKRGRNRWMAEVLPFWVMTLLGLLCSTVAVAYADHRWGTPLAISAASLAGFGVVWIAKFVVLDRWLFGVDPPAELADTHT